MNSSTPYMQFTTSLPVIGIGKIHPKEEDLKNFTKWEAHPGSF
jgi:hypothetical protein